jgi:O-antigen ligase
MKWYISLPWRIHWVGLMLGGALLFPALDWPGSQMGLPKVRIEEILLGMGLLINLILALKSALFQRKMYALEPSEPFPFFFTGLEQEGKLIFAFILLTLSILLSDLYGGLFLGVPISFHDGMEFVTLAKYFLLLFVGASIPWTQRAGRVLLIYTLGAFLISNFISWSQAGNWFQVNSWLTPWYSPRHLGVLTIARIPRVLGTFGNPNYTGIFAAIVFLLATLRLLQMKSPFWIIIALLSVKLQIMVISRTALLAMGAGFFVLLSLFFRYRDRWVNPLLNPPGNFLFSTPWRRLLLLLFGSLLLLLASPNFFFERVNEGIHVTTSSSVNQHVELWKVAWSSIQASPLFGWGTAKELMTSIVDNDYLLIWRRYGLVGLAAFFYLFARLALLARVTSLGAKLAVYSSLTVLAVFNLAAGTWYHLQLMALFWLGIGLILGKYRTHHI